jgi:hypothetical protein
MVTVLAIGPKACEFKPSRRWCIFKGDKNPSHNFFGGEVKPLIPYCKILWHVKNPTGMKRDTL